ncbi:MAG: hypothetical protein DMF92_05190 [Acidobacteria bacterium]|nr:MAG: hypothetical protein DMF92_05190 [Acidobacteriota bacterium]
MKAALGVCLIGVLLSTPAHATVYYVTIAGLVGEPDYEQRFTASAKDLDKQLKATGADAHVYSLTGGEATRARLTQVLGEVARDAKPEDDFVLILIGHGSYDGVEYKFNLVGPDMSAANLAALCNRVPAKRQLIVNATSSSGGSIPAFQRAGRAVIASTKSGTEKNATVFARYFVEALQDPAADVDKNESVSALEAFQYAERKTNEFYTSQKRLATEHAVFEDTGKGEPVRAPAADIGEGRLLSSLTLVRFGEAQKAALDPAKRDLLAKKEDLERQIDVLKYQKAAMSQNEYEQQLKALLVGLARVQAAMDK